MHPKLSELSESYSRLEYQLSKPGISMEDENNATCDVAAKDDTMAIAGEITVSPPDKMRHHVGQRTTVELVQKLHCGLQNL